MLKTFGHGVNGLVAVQDAGDFGWGDSGRLLVIVLALERYND
jgi:hypothetical protein